MTPDNPIAPLVVTPTQDELRRWFPHRDFAGEQMREGQFREPWPDADDPLALLDWLQRVPMTEWVWHDAERIFATLASFAAHAEKARRGAAETAEQYQSPTCKCNQCGVVRGIAAAIRTTPNKDDA